MSPTMPVIEAASPHEALTRDALASIGDARLGAWLAGRRWFAAKGEPPRTVRVAAVVPLPWEDGAWVVSEIVTEGARGSARWHLPLAVWREQLPRPEAAEALAEVRWPEGQGVVIDAVYDPRFLRHLADTFAQPGSTADHYGASFAAGEWRWTVETLGHEAFVVPADATIHVASGEQSNTSILVGGLAILKLFRRLEAGEHPDVEVTRFLTKEAGFPNTPTLLGTIRLEQGEHATVVGMLQEYLPDSVDAWRWTLEAGKAYFSGTRDSGLGTRDSRGSNALPVPEPRVPSPGNSYPAAAERLGVITRAMHEALASEPAEQDLAFAPEPADPDDVDRWAESTRVQIRESLDLLDRQLAAGAVPKERAAEAQAIARRRDDYLHHVDTLADALHEDAGCVIRHHGDYHLGQVLRTHGGDFMIIDFEGEPSRPLLDRRRKHSALRDVAGMLRSFAYAAATLAVEAGSGLAMAERETRAARWEREARDAFLRGYLRGPSVSGGVPHPPDAPEDHGHGDDEPGFLPESETNVRRLVALFELEKVFYELEYELHNRPNWAWIPMRGVSKVLVG